MEDMVLHNHIHQQQNMVEVVEAALLQIVIEEATELVLFIIEQLII
jgi:hypothetical protein